MNFDSLSHKTILHISYLIEDADSEGLIDIDDAEGVLICTTSQGRYVLNKNTAAQEIWLASPVSGPHHFRYHENVWLNKDNDDLYQLIADEIDKITGIKINIKK